jgi:hypothetical protein
MSRASNRAVDALAMLGWPGLAGAALVLASLWVQHQVLPRWQTEVDDGGSEVRRLRHALQEAASASAPAPGTVVHDDTPQQAWARLWQALPDASQRVALQEQVLASAAAAGLQIDAVQYRGEFVPWQGDAKAAVKADMKALDPAGQALWRQRMSMPVQGSYPAVRQWLAGLMQSPALSIDALDLQRPDVMDQQVKAQVSVSLWWRQDRRP